jgi:phospholipid-binding lipoprotein MlaA
MILKPRVKLASFLGLAALLIVMTGCATPPPADDPDAVSEFRQLNDPFEPMNRKIFAFNDWLDDNALVPLARAYRAVVPRLARARVTDALGNLKAPGIFANDVLEGDLSRAGITLSRFLLNTTFGVAGIMDVATPMGLPAHNADAGQTFAVWGVPEGPYLVLPLFGPSNPRDTVGLSADSFLDPVSSTLDNNGLRWVSWVRVAVTGISTREAYIDVVEDIKRTSIDFYSAMRSLKRQSRDAQIREALKGDWASDSANNPH